MDTYKEITKDISQHVGKLRDDIPDVLKSFSSMGSAATEDGALDHKTKELIALSLGVAGHCEGCIGFHTQALAKAGATKKEVSEALGVAVYMGGGPSLMFAANAMRAFEEAGGS